MPDFQQLIESGSAHVWLYIPIAILLGALHGLEPGHSKTMMAAFIIAIRGTVFQAVLLGLSAAISHSLIIWLLAALALTYGSQWSTETTEPYFHLASAAMIFGLALWMFFRTRREVAEAAEHSLSQPHPQMIEKAVEPAEHDPIHDHGHHHHQESHNHIHAPASLEPISPSGLIVPGQPLNRASTKLVLPGESAPFPAAVRKGRHGGLLLDTGHGWLEIAIHKSGVLPLFRVYPCRSGGEPVPLPRSTEITIDTARLDGSSQRFQFDARDGYWESASELPEPHRFLAVVRMGHGDHVHTYRVKFEENHEQEGLAPVATLELDPEDAAYQDAHERAHAEDIARRFSNRTVTTSQIVLFGITGGLMPCPAAFTILLVCLQLKRATLGFTLVGAFSFGLALTMVAVGAMAAWSVHHAQKRFSGFNDWMRRAPYISCVLLTLLAVFMAWQGWQGLHGHLGHAH